MGAEIEELGDPEAGPSLPSTTLATHAIGPDHVSEPSRRGGTGTTREIVRLAWPTILSQSLVALAGLADRAMVGRLSEDGGAAVPLAAVGFATQFFFLIQAALFAVSLACVALMARSIGAGHPRRAQQALGASLRVGLGVSLLFGTLMAVGARPAFQVLGATPDVTAAGLPYLQLILASSVALAASLVFDAALRSNKDMRTPMYVSFAVTGLKLLLNWVLIFGNLGAPRLELVGAGLATLIAQVFGLTVFVVLIFRAGADSPLRLRWREALFANPLSRDVVRIAVPGIAERVIMNLAMLSYFWVIGHYYGTLQVAAYTVGIALLSFTWMPGQGYAQACATVVGQALGSNDEAQAIRAGWRAAALALGTAVVLGIPCALFRYPLARVFTSDEAVVLALGPFMLALAIAQPFLQLHFTLGGAHRGAGDTWSPLVAATIGNWVFRVPLALLFAVHLGLDVVWLWYTILFDHIARAAYLTWTFQRGSWKHRL